MIDKKILTGNVLYTLQDMSKQSINIYQLLILMTNNVLYDMWMLLISMAGQWLHINHIRILK